MTNRISGRLQEAAASGRIGIMPFLTGGFPRPDLTADLICACNDAGAAAIEIGFPFTDPIADGPVISASMQSALEAGSTPQAIIQSIRTIRAQVQAGLIGMASQSICHRMGGADWLDELSDAGFDGVIIPDCDLDDADAFAQRADELGLAFGLLVSPTTSIERATRITGLCRGFIYMLARTGLTGEQSAVPNLDQRIAELRAMTDLPVAVGFGISSPDHVKAVAQWADAAIVGSALIRRLAQTSDPVETVQRFVSSLVGASARAVSSN